MPILGSLCLGVKQARKSSEWSPGSNRSLSSHSRILSPSSMPGVSLVWLCLPSWNQMHYWWIADWELNYTEITGLADTGTPLSCQNDWISAQKRRESVLQRRLSSPLSADLLGMPNRLSLVHSVTDDLPNNCSCSWAASWLDSAAQSRRETLFTAKPVSGQCGTVVHFVIVHCDGFNICACACRCVFVYSSG